TALGRYCEFNAITRCADPADLVGGALGEPERAVRASRDARRIPGGISRNREIGIRAISRHVADAVDTQLGEPERPVRASGDRARGGWNGDRVHEAGGADPPDLV